MILVDTSAWIEFRRATGSTSHRRLRQAIAAEQPLGTMGIVLLEFLAGARDDSELRELTRLPGRCAYLPLEEPGDHEAAAVLYRSCRAAGETVRRLTGCLIAVVAIRTGMELLHRDADFDVIARHAPLAVAP